MFEVENPIDYTRFFVVTHDGWHLAVHRYRPRRTTIFEPVLLVHGLGANRYNLDAPGRNSVARYLSAAGADCFVVELRGAGESMKPTPANGLNWGWTFDDYVHVDLPAVVDTILKITERTALHWLGHSMGGMLGYAFTGGKFGHRVRSLTAIGSPCFTQYENPLFDASIHLRPFVKNLKRLPYEGMGKFLVPALPLFRETFGRLLANPRNLDLFHLQAVLRLAPSSLPTSLILQFAQWHEAGQVVLKDGIRLTQLVAESVVPTLLVIGSEDRLASLADQRNIFALLASSSKSLLILSKELGCRYDYGHIDPVLGRYAPTEVFPHFVKWIRAHDESTNLAA